MFSRSEETRRLILHTLDHMLHFTHPTGLLESSLITVMLQINIHTVKWVVCIKWKAKTETKRTRPL